MGIQTTEQLVKNTAISEQDSHEVSPSMAHVEDVTKSPGRPLDASVRSTMESRFSNRLGSSSPFSSVPGQAEQGIRVNEHGDKHELEAHRATSQLMQPTVQKKPSTSPSYDFSKVRIHTDSAAQSSAAAVDAKAYTFGNNIVFGSGAYQPESPEGQHLLAHELTHVAQQNQEPTTEPATVQRFGLFESIGRFFQNLGGLFTLDAVNDEETLTLYLDILEATREIEDLTDSDNKARGVIDQDMHKDQPLHIKVLLVKELLSGFTGDDDEGAILTLIEDASPVDREKIVEQVGTQELIENFHGEELDKLYRLVASINRNKKSPLNTEWNFSYDARGAENIRNPNDKIVVDNFAITPDKTGETMQVASDVINESGTPVTLNSSIDHPRDSGGTGRITFHTDSGRASRIVPTRLSQTYEPITRDKRRINAHLNITYEASRTGDTSNSTANVTGQDVQHTGGTRTFSGSDTTTSSGSTNTVNANVSGSVTNSAERTDSAGVQAGSSSTVETSVRLAGRITPSIRGSVNFGTEFQTDGRLLGLLLAAAGPEGMALYGLLNGLGVLESTQFKVTQAGELGFGLELELSGEVARKWSETQSVMASASSSVTRGESATGSAGVGASRSSSSGMSTTEYGRVETTDSTTTITRGTRTQTNSGTQFNLVPVIKDATLTFNVR